MTYAETVQFLYSSLPVFQRVGKAAYKADLKTTVALDDHLGNPHNRYKTIHIAGTNGKGSVSHIIASVLRESGYKTGLYTSPHLRDFRERVKVNGLMVDKDYVVDFVKKNRPIIDSLKPSFFEMTVAMALQYFADENVDIAVIETGMGGRLDSTNIITPDLSVITNIGLDHTQFLGTTIEQIAVEKGGIIKPEIPVVIGETASLTRELFKKLAGQKSSEIWFADEIWSVIQTTPDPGHGRMRLNLYKDGEEKFSNFILGLGGNYQLQNILTVAMSIDIIRKKFQISDNNILSGYRDVVTNTGFEGRWQVISENPLTICDTAHNLDGISEVVRQLSALGSRQIRFILGFVDDKDIEPILSLFPEAGQYYFTQASIPRSLGHSLLKKKASESGLTGLSYPTVKEAYSAVKNDAIRSDIIYIGGSTFVVAEFLENFV